MSNSNDWLDTQTKAQLERSPPDKLAPPVVAGYSLVLLERGCDIQRVDRTLRALIEDRNYVPRKCPFVVRRELSLADAIEGQFELICTDSISVFVNDDVVRTAKASYLYDLFETVRNSSEFQPIRVHLKSVPDDERGRRFLSQFFGQVLNVPTTHVVARKKARIMYHWGNKLGAVIEPEDP